MDWSILLGIAGILVSVLVGWLTYRLADRRGKSHRYLAAKSTVLQELSKSLGEDAVPSSEIIESTIRSVLRETGDPTVKLEVQDILDDLMRQVTSDPFLDRERRRKLQGDIEQVRTAWFARDRTPLKVFQVEMGEMQHLRSSILSGAAGLLAALASLMAMSVGLTRTADTDGPLKLQRLLGAMGQVTVAPVVGAIVVVGFLLVMVLVFSDGFRDFLLRRFNRKKP